VGLALEYHRDPKKIASTLAAFIEEVRRDTDYGLFAPLTAAEAGNYQRGDHTLYQTRTTGLTTLTDTTERSPTFSLAAFENIFAPEQPKSLTYLQLTESPDAASAWRALLLREPRTLEWPGLEKLTSRNWIIGYDFSDQVRKRRKGDKTIEVEIDDENMFFCVTHFCGYEQLSFSVPAGGLLCAHLYLKLLLNAHSTALMARLGRCQGNLMTYVRASNLKLIDRAVRYARHLWKIESGKEISYETVVRALFTIRPNLGPDEPAVLRVVEYLRTHK
jgi:N-acetylmuramic acid 6-phosphate etherase